jgi:hypothetical protein
MIRHSLSTLVEFGNGTVALSPRLSVEGYGLLGLDMCEPHEIGQYLEEEEEGEAVDINECPILLAFKNVESLDVLIEDLNIIRKHMVTFENKETE